MRNYPVKKHLASAIIFALLSGPTFAGSSDYSSAAIANDTGIAQSTIDAGTDWLNADANSDTDQNSNTLDTGNALGGQSQTENTLASNQSTAATDPDFVNQEGNDQSLYEGYWNNYKYNEGLANSASSAYNTCLADGESDCINASGTYAAAANKDYSEYEYYYGLWNDDVQQAQAMNETASQQSTLSGASSQNSASSYQAYEDALNAINSQSTEMTQNVQNANAGSNSGARAEGDSSASSQIASLDAAANTSIANMESQTGQTFQTTPSTGVAMSAATPGPVADAHSNANYQSDAQGMADASGSIAAVNQEYGQQPDALPTTAATTSPAGSGEIEDSQLQTTINNLSNAATQNAENALIQKGYANNRAADATSADDLSSADSAAATVAPTPESGAMWDDGSSLDAQTANQYQQDATSTAATASEDLQTFKTDQAQADSDALQMNSNLTEQADAQAATDLSNNGITQTAPTVSSTDMQNAMNKQEAAMNAAQISAEVYAAKALSAEQKASNANSVATTDSQLQQADSENAQSTTSADLQSTWNALSDSYQSSMASAQSAANNDTSQANNYTAKADAEESEATQSDSGYGVNTDAISAGNSAAAAAISAINAEYGNS